MSKLSVATPHPVLAAALARMCRRESGTYFMNRTLPSLVLSLLLLSLLEACTASVSETAKDTGMTRQAEVIRERIKKHRAQERKQATVRQTAREAAGANH